MADELTVTRNDELSRYEARLADGTVVAFSVFKQRPGRVVFIHTETDPAYGGRGYGTRLVHDALEDVRSRGESIGLVCPFVKAYVDKHPEYADLVAA
jgi:predicted GNAT family acetyltransferase